MGGPSNGRLTPLLRWLGLTMVVILLLQMVALRWVTGQTKQPSLKSSDRWWRCLRWG